MKVVSVVSSIFVLFIVLRIIVWGVRQFNEPDRSQSTGVRQQVPFDQQLEIFRQLHFDLNPEVDSSDIASWELDDSTAEEQPFMLVYTLLGSCIEREPFTPITNRAGVLTQRPSRIMAPMWTSFGTLNESAEAHLRSPMSPITSTLTPDTRGFRSSSTANAIGGRCVSTMTGWTRPCLRTSSSSQLNTIRMAGSRASILAIRQ